MKPRVALMFNPMAGRRSRHQRHKKLQILQRLSLAGFTDVVDLAAANVRDNVRQARALAHEGRIELLIVAGGDGMVHAGVNAIFGTTVTLGIIAIGTGNDTARQLGLPRHNIAAAVELIAQRYNQPVRVDCGGAHNLDTGETRYFLGVFSQGIDADVNARANHYSLRLGTLTYLVALANILRSFSGYFGAVQAAKYAHRGGLTIVSVANFAQFGGGISIAPGAQVTDGRLDLIVAPRLSKLQILGILPKVFLGKHLGDRRVHHSRETAVSVGGEQLPLAFADGELLGSGPFDIQCHRAAISVISGKELR